jgi:hypothetical protein
MRTGGTPWRSLISSLPHTTSWWHASLLWLTSFVVRQVACPLAHCSIIMSCALTGGESSLPLLNTSADW